MIHPKCFSLQWIQEKRKELGVTDPGILEKSIHALALLSHLSDSGLEFVFKGGTSLLLHLSPIRRLSIDIDIACNETPDRLEAILKKVAATPPFIRFREDERGTRRLPKRRHFRFSYNQIEGGHPAPYVLLDIVEGNCALPVIRKPIITDFIEIEKETITVLPTIEGLLGDKLTAFAPTTIGVPYFTSNGDSMAMQVAKQMFDIGELFNHAVNTTEIIIAYKTSFEKENSYRDTSFSIGNTLNDTLMTCNKLCHWGLKGCKDDVGTAQLLRGISTLPNHLVQTSFRPNIEAKIASAKAALLCSLIQNNSIDKSLVTMRYSTDFLPSIENVVLEGNYKHLQRLKSINPEAFYYWKLIEQYTGQREPA